MNKIMFFAHLRDVVGEEFVTMDVSGKSVADVKALISSKYNLTQLESAMTAVNEEFASNDEIVQSGDVIAFIPPVSGG